MPVPTPESYRQFLVWDILSIIYFAVLSICLIYLGYCFVSWIIEKINDWIHKEEPVEWIIDDPDWVSINNKE